VDGSQHCWDGPHAWPRKEYLRGGLLPLVGLVTRFSLMLVYEILKFTLGLD
jgi:hypothetical protein